MSGDNYRREVGKLKRRVGVGSEPEAVCPTCGQGVTKAGAAAIEARRKEAAEAARHGLIAYVEEVAEHQRLSEERVRRKAEVEADLREAGKLARERARRSESVAVAEVKTVDVRPTLAEQEQGENDTTAQAVKQYMDDDPLSRILHKRREQREREREEQKTSQRPTVTNNRGGEE